MRKEKIILSFTALFVGILVALLIFYFYQSGKEVKPEELEKITLENPSPSPSSSIFLVLEKPIDEDVVDNRIITVSGKTAPNAKVVILTQTNEVGAVAAQDGSFSSNITLSEGENVVEVDAVAANGEIAKATRVVTFSTESF